MQIYFQGGGIHFSCRRNTRQHLIERYYVKLTNDASSHKTETREIYFCMEGRRAYDTKHRNGALARIFVQSTLRFFFDVVQFLFIRHRSPPLEYVIDPDSLRPGRLIISYRLLEKVFLQCTLIYRSCRVVEQLAAHVNRTLFSRFAVN